MGYEDLIKFSVIFNSDDFNYISNLDNIYKISEIIRYRVTIADGKEEHYIELLSLFANRLRSFYYKIGGKEVPDLEEGYTECWKIMQQIGALLRLPEEKRGLVSRGYLRKFNKMFLHGLSKIYSGILKVFNSKYLPITNISNQQIINFILNKGVGLGNRFKMNIVNGRYTFVPHLNDLSKEELVKTIETLSLGILSRHPIINEWRVMGDGKGVHAVRIHFTEPYFTKPRLYRIYRVYSSNEHDAHVKDANNLRVKDCKFIAA